MSGVVTFGVVWSGQAVTITLDGEGDRLTWRTEGLFGLGARSVHYPLSGLRGAAVEAFAPDRSGARRARLALILGTGTRRPMTEQYARGRYEDYRAIAEDITAYVKAARRPRPMGPGEVDSLQPDNSRTTPLAPG